MNSKHQQVKLNDGHFIPGLGFGTYTPEEVTLAVWRMVQKKTYVV
jgi:hypothetical protein